MEELSEKWSFSYPKDKQIILIKVVIISVISIFLIGVAYSDFNNSDIGIATWAFVFFGIAGTVDVISKLHRILVYDEICIKDNYLIVKNRGRILSKTPVEDIYIISKTNPFDMFQVSWKRLYCDQVLLFHYATNEIDADYEQKLTKLIERGV